VKSTKVRGCVSSLVTEERRCGWKIRGEIEIELRGCLRGVAGRTSEFMNQQPKETKGVDHMA